MLLPFLAMLGLLSTLGWNAAAMACPLDSAAVTAHRDSCGHAPTPAKSQLPSHPGQICAVCVAVLPPPMQIAATAPPPSAALPSAHQRLSGVDPGLDPPPPRSA